MSDLAAVASGLLYLVAAVLLLVVRTWQQYRSTGATGFNGFRGAAQHPAAQVAGIGFATAVLTGLAAPWLAAAGVLPVWSLPIAVTAVGAVVAAGGLQLGMTAQRTMGRSWRIGVDVTEATDLVTDGPFRWIRNPIFTGLIMIQLGTATMAATWLSLVGAALMITACQIQTRLVEEPYLRSCHTTYPDYAATAGRFVPGLGRFHPTPLSSHAAGDPA